MAKLKRVSEPVQCLKCKGTGVCAECTGNGLCSSCEGEGGCEQVGRDEYGRYEDGYDEEGDPDCEYCDHSGDSCPYCGPDRVTFDEGCDNCDDGHCPACSGTGKCCACQGSGKKLKLKKGSRV